MGQPRVHRCHGGARSLTQSRVDTVAPPQVSLRPAETRDREFLVRLYRTTREAELSLVPWSEDEKQQFAELQFAAQDAAYHGRYPDGDFLIVEAAGQPIGRLYTGRLPDEIRVIDIVLLPEFCGRGIGGGLIATVMDRATGAGLAVRLYVEQWNPDGIYDLLEWRPPAAIS